MGFIAAVAAAVIAFEVAVVLGSGSHPHHVAAPAAGAVTAGPYHPAPPPPRPVSQTRSDLHPPSGAFMIGRVLHPMRTSVGLIKPRTPFGEDTWLLILRHHGDRGVALVPTKGEPKPAVVDLAKLELRWTRVKITVRLSRLQLIIKRGKQVLGTFPIAAGMPSTPTPTGQFSVTDRIVFPHGGTYGTFALGLSARQTHLVPGWTGGDQVAIHGTDQPGSIGSYASLGCIRVSEAALHVLQRAVPLGAPVRIRA